MPLKRSRVDNLGRTVRAFRLKSRRRIRVQLLVVIDLELIKVTGCGRDPAAEVAAVLPDERGTFSAPGHDSDAGGRGSPYANVSGARVDELGANRQPAAKR
jgi:hypothetical protein